jgi:dipeptidyl aminopeptidase/acylaminoacyl peptidase
VHAEVDGWGGGYNSSDSFSCQYGYLSIRPQTLEGGDFTWESEYNGSPTVWPIPGSYAAGEPYFDMYKITAPLLFTHGEDDDVCPLSQSRIGYHTLMSLGKQTGLVTYPKEGHGFDIPSNRIDRAARISAWFDEHLPVNKGD